MMDDKTHSLHSGLEKVRAIEESYSARERRVLRLWLRLVRTSRRVEADVSAQMHRTFGVRFVRFELNSGYHESSTYTGIAEIQFTGTLVPEPGVTLLGGIGLLGLLRRRR